jgi:hypothetical protein
LAPSTQKFKKVNRAEIFSEARPFLAKIKTSLNLGRQRYLSAN